MTFSEQIVYAMFKPSKYKELIKLKKSRFVLFAMVISLVLGIINFIIPTGALIARVGGFEELFGRKIGSIKYENGTLRDESKYELNFNGMHFLINTENEKVADSLKTKDGIYITFGSKYVQMSMVYDDQVINYQTFAYEGMLREGFDNDALIEFIPTIYVYLVLMFIFECIGFFLRYAIYALILCIMVNSINRRLELNLKFGEVFRLCFYGETVGILATNFNAAIGLFPVLLMSFLSIYITVRMISAACSDIAKAKQL